MKNLSFYARRRSIWLAGCSLFCAPALSSRLVHIEDSLTQPKNGDDAAFINRAFEMRRLAIESGDQSYGAIVVKDFKIVGQSPSRVVVNGDPTAHAEMEAIRDAAKRLRSRDLSGCTLFSTSKACPMCEGAAYWAGISRMIYGEVARDGGRPNLC